jgi:hypothetical protein
MSFSVTVILLLLIKTLLHSACCNYMLIHLVQLHDFFFNILIHLVELYGFFLSTF